MMTTVIIATDGVKTKKSGFKELIWEAWTDTPKHNHRLVINRKRDHSEQEEVQDGEKLFVREEERALKQRDSQEARKNR